MASQLQTQLINLIQEVKTLGATGLTNPLIAPMNANGYEISNLNNIYTTNGQSLTIHTNNDLIVNAPVIIQNDNGPNAFWCETITNPSSIVKIDSNMNMGIGVPPATPLVKKLEVAGDIECDDIECKTLYYTALSPPIPAGNVGPTGPQGIAGPTGLQGQTGIQGPTGIQGLIGPTGAQGIQGLQGATGPAGPTSSPSLSQVLAVGNSAGGLNISNVNNLSCSQLNYTTLNPPVSSFSNAYFTNIKDAYSVPVDLSPSPSAWTIGIDVDTINNESSNFTWDSVNKRWICNQAGTYLITYNYVVGSISPVPNTQIRFIVYKGDLSVPITQIPSSYWHYEDIVNGETYYPSNSSVVSLAVNDTIYFATYSNYTSTKFIYFNASCNRIA